MFRLFNKREATDNGNRRSGGHPAASPSSARKTSEHEDLTFRLDIPVDDSMRAIDSRLSSLSRIEVGQAAKERGWAAIHSELERHPVRPTASALLRGTGAKVSTRPGSLQPVPVGGGHSRGWRIALSSAGAVVVILAAVLGVYGAGLLGGGTGPVAVSTTAIADVPTTASTDLTTPTSESTPGTDATVTTETPGTSDTTPVTDGASTTESTPATTPVTGGGTTPSTQGTTPTTKPTSPGTTTSSPVYASAETVKDAKDAALNLGDAVLAHFMGTGDIDSVRSLVASSARSRLTQMIASLEEPTGVSIVADSVKPLSSDGKTVRITLEFLDVDDSPRFFITVRVTDQGATITDISAAS